MDEKEILDELTEHFYQGWDVVATGGGFLITTDWVLPTGERIEIHIRRVGDREDLFLVSDGGELINLLFSQGVDLSKDRESRRVLDGVAEKHSIKVADYQFVKGAGEADIAQAVRDMLEAVKEASFLLWHKIGSKPADSMH
jgi:hypothetical protein